MRKKSLKFQSIISRAPNLADVADNTHGKETAQYVLLLVRFAFEQGLTHRPLFYLRRSVDKLFCRHNLC